MPSARRQALFEGTEPPAKALRLDPAQIRALLGPRLEGLDGPLDITKFKGGQSNPTYRIAGPGATYVLRRKPPGARVASAHAIDREYRLLTALAAADMPVPRPLLFCDDEEPLGFAFYVVEHVAGRVFWDADLPGVDPADRRIIYDEMIRVLARLHELDLDALGLEDLAPRGSYVSRNLARWSRLYEQSKLVEVPDMDWLRERLPALIPADEQARLIHGDYGLYNIILDPAEPRLLAVLDWEMATIGDPFVDLAHHLRPWWEVPDRRGVAATSLVGLDLAALGIPALESQVAAYAGYRSLPLPDLRFHLAFAQYRYAAMIQGILARAADGSASGRVLHRQERVFEAAALARRSLSALV